MIHSFSIERDLLAVLRRWSGTRISFTRLAFVVDSLLCSLTDSWGIFPRYSLLSIGSIHRVFTNRGATYRNQPTQPAQPTSETPDWLPTPRFISPLGFDHAKEKSTAWRPAVGVKEAVERWIEVVPGDRVAELGGGYTRVDFEQTPELARLSDAEFQGILRKAAEPETRKRFLAWVREGMPPLDGWTPKQVEGVEGVEVVVPPGAARAFSASLIPPPASEEVHPPTFAHHIPATASAEADSSKPTASIRALLESTRSLPRIRGRVLGSNKEGGVSVGIAGFVASAPATPTLSESRRNRLVEFQVTRAVPTKDSFELEVSEVEKRKEKRVLPAAGKGKLEKPGKGLRFFGKDKGEKAVEKAADK